MVACVKLYYEHLQKKAEATKTPPPSPWLFGFAIFTGIFMAGTFLIDDLDGYVMFLMVVFAAGGTWVLLK